MILYTVASVEAVLGEYTDWFDEGRKIGKDEIAEEIAVSGGIVCGRRCAEGFKAERLITTDLKMYLDERYFPGRIIKTDNDTKLYMGMKR
ncbi:MAG: hypothetical protein J5874_01535 [Oscillospiraceae bacterium]|nr:hypothetical protein [Oscillospiraceae bacterium]